MSNGISDGFKYSQSIKLWAVNPTSFHCLRSPSAAIASDELAGGRDLLV